jgi:hypothetical protein
MNLVHTLSPWSIASMVNHNPVDGGYPTVQEMSDYLSPDQALEDTIQLITYIRNEIGCDPDKTHPNYCPIITVSFITFQPSSSGIQPESIDSFIQTAYVQV